MKVIGLIALEDLNAFDEYRRLVGATIEQYGGKILMRGKPTTMLWNELNIPQFHAFVELEFPNHERALQWANSPEYQSLVPIRSKAMRLTLLGFEAA
jgi:uncharacterized protein (DUF1330 family)